jgi:hypothetical protein
MSRRFGTFMLTVGLVSSWCGLPLAAQDGKTEPTPEQRLLQERLDLMQRRMAQFVVTPKKETADFPKAFEPKPIFRYDDPARGYVAAAVWRLGDTGRPLAIITTELQPRFYNQPRIVYEYLSLTDQPFTAFSPDYRWTPEKNALQFKAIPGSQAPAETPALRLTQMRNEARRFTAFQVVGKERVELRLLPQPILRYTPSEKERADGGVFLLAFGTNPEALLFLESDGKAWNYALGRLSGSSLMKAQIDEQDAWEVGPARYQSTESYTASNAQADIPGIDPNGNVIPMP